MSDIQTLAETWLEAKAAEKEAQGQRRFIEAQLLTLLKVTDDLEGTQNEETESLKIKITGRMNRKVDSDLIQEIAEEEGTAEHLSSLFRWKPEMNMSVWKNTDSAITTPLLAGITTKPGTPSFAITNKEEK